MSTTDWNGREPVTPYNIYLMKPEQRRGAYWHAWSGHAQQFATPQEAEAEARRILPPDRYGSSWDVAPHDHRAMPDFWELRDMR
jgi:hypothetical protein